MGLPFYRGRPVHNTNLLEKWLFSIIYSGKNIQSIFMKFSEFVYLVKDYGPYAKKGAPSIKELLPKDSEELPKGTS